MPAADDLRRVLRRAGRRPRTVLRSLWVRFRSAWRGVSDRRSGEPIPAGLARSRLLAGLGTVGARDGKGGDLRRCHADRHRRGGGTDQVVGMIWPGSPYRKWNSPRTPGGRGRAIMRYAMSARCGGRVTGFIVARRD